MKIVPFPICLDTQDVDEIVAAVKAVAPVFAGITDIVVSDVHGVAHGAREDIVRDGAENLVLLSERTNKRGVTGTLRQATPARTSSLGSQRQTCSPDMTSPL